MLGARLIPLTPSHHLCEGRPPALQASRAQRAINSAVASAACLEGGPGPVTPSTTCERRKNPVDASSPKDLHYYEPRNGHGLRHDPFNAIIAPRPIGWISSRDAKGNVNLAPYSFFNGFCYTPPIIGFSPTSWKDSVQNVQETGELVWNLATMALAKQMNATAAHVAHDVSAFQISGLTAVPGKLVNVPRV